MNSKVVEGLKFSLDKIMHIKPGERILLLVDNRSCCRPIAQSMMDLAVEMGAEVVMSTMEMRRWFGDEPPKQIHVASKEVDVLIHVSENFDITHTNTRMEASAAGIRYYVMLDTLWAENFLTYPFTEKDLKEIEERTVKICEIMDKAETVKLTDPNGTDLTMSIKGRNGMRIFVGHPTFSVFPDYAEAHVVPVEGTSEGTMVCDTNVQGWGYLLRKPVRMEVKKGRIILDSIQCEIKEDEEKVRNYLSKDENANNFVCEFAIGTSHIVPRFLTSGVRDYSINGSVHVASGRNIDIAGDTYSVSHQDFLLMQATAVLDGQCILKDGVLQI